MRRKPLAALQLVLYLVTLVACSPASEVAPGTDGQVSAGAAAGSGATGGTGGVSDDGGAGAGTGADGSAVHSGRVTPDWRRLDLNRDGRFDRADYDLLIAEGMAHPAVDVNGDGSLDLADAFAAMVEITRWDRNADGQVDDDDFLPPATSACPRPTRRPPRRWLRGCSKSRPGRFRRTRRNCC